MRVFYPAGGDGPPGGGAQWIAEFDEGMEEAYLEYKVKFRSGFDFVRGGKLPGMAVPHLAVAHRPMVSEAGVDG